MDRAFLCRLMASTAVLAWTVLPQASQAQAPQAPTVASGSISINRQGATTIVTQGTDKGIIDWRSFSIGPQEAVRFDQPGRSSVTLNRVTGSELSRIDGALSATGQVWLANPNGVMIGPGGQINVGGLLATTGRIDAQQFLKTGRADIDQISKDAAIVNSGAITIGAGGYAALAAAALRNEGVIAVRAGSIAMGAGKAATVDFVGDKLISFQVTQPLDQAPANAEALLVNKGVISAAGGTVLMSARAAKGVIDNVINMSGHVVADSIRVDGGTVTVGDGGAALVSAKIDASNSEGVGGLVSVLAEKVGLMDGAVIDASGATGGGVVSIGGEWQGKGETGTKGQNATATYVAPTASINVDANKVGEGGVTVIWSDGVTRFHGTISAKGGVVAGDGGKVETSGKAALQVGPTASVVTANRSPASKAGSWLLDPTDITIQAGGAGALSGGIFAPTAASVIDPATISDGLVSGDVTIQTSAGSGGFGDIAFVSGAISYSGTAPRSLTLAADRNVTMGPGTTIAANAGRLNVSLLASATATTQDAVLGGISLQGATIATPGGSVLLAAGANGALAASGGATLGGVGVSISQNSSISLGDSTVTIRGRGRLDPSLSVDNPHGVWIDSSRIFADGAITLRGVGGDNPNSAAHGVFINNTLMGSVNSVSIDGVGGAGGSAGGGDRRGVVMVDTTITNDAGSTTVSGAGGAGADRNIGVHLVNSRVGGQRDLTLTTPQGSGSDVVLQTGLLTYGGTGTGALSILSDANVILSDQSSTNSLGSSGNVRLNPSAYATSQSDVSGGVKIGGAFILAWNNKFSLGAGQDGSLSAVGNSVIGGSGAQIADSRIVLGPGAFVANGRGGDNLSVDVAHGLSIERSTISATGGVTMSGAGGDKANLAAYGVFLNFAEINGVNGSLFIDGVGGAEVSNAKGVMIANSVLKFGETAPGAAASIISGIGGTGGGRNVGIHLDSSAITSFADLTLTTPSGSGSDIVLAGASHSAQRSFSASADANVTMADSTINSQGDVRILASAHAATQSEVAGGIRMTGGGVFAQGNFDLAAGKSGTLSAVGNSVTAENNLTLSSGVQIGFTTISLGGAMKILGTGRNDAGAVSYANGVTLYGTNIMAPGGVTIVGKGGDTATSQARGVDLQNSSFNVTAGAVFIDGTGGAAAADSKGVYLSDSYLTSFAGPLSITGISGAAGTAYRNFGIHVRGSTLTLGSFASFTTPSGAGSDIAFEATSIGFTGATAQTLSVASHANVFMYDGSAITANGGAPLNVVFKASANAQTQSEVSGGVHIHTGSISTRGGNLDLVAGKSGELLAVGNSLVQGRGVQIWENAVIDLGSGALKALGGGRSDAGDNYAQGVEIDNSVVIANGGLTLIGKGGDNALIEGHGVIVKDSKVSVLSGDININGVGGAGPAEARGVSLWNASIVQGTGKTTISGVAGATSTAPIRAGIYIDGASLSSSGHVTLTGEGPTGITISGAPTPGGGPEITAAALSISTQGTGNKINATVGGLTGPAAAAAVDLRSGTIEVNGVLIPAVTASSTATTASLPSLSGTTPTVATIASVPSIASVPTVASVPTMVTQIAEPPPIFVPFFPPPFFPPPFFPPPFFFPPPIAPTPLFISLISSPIFINSVLPQILIPAPNFGLAPPPIPFFLPPPGPGFNPAFFAPPGAVMSVVFPGLLYIASFPPPPEP